MATRLHAVYRSPRHNNKADPLDELVFIILSQMTTTPSFNRVFDRLKRSVRSWGELLVMPPRKIESLIKDAGLSHQKGPRLRRILKRVSAEFGRASLDSLHKMTDEDAEAFLTSLPGVGTKTAKCVMMYSLGRAVLPVDTHVARLACRLSVLSAADTTARAHVEIERAVRPADRYSFHVNGVAHGQGVCRAVRPKCQACVLRRMCQHPEA